MATIRQRKRRGKAVFHVQVRMAGFPARTKSFPTRRLADRWATKIEAQMIEGRHFRDPEARNRTLTEAIDRYMAEEAPKKRGVMTRANLQWWRDRLGHLKLSEISPAILVEHRGKLQQEPYKRAKPESPRSIVKGDAKQFKRSAATVNRYLQSLSHVFTIAMREWHWLEHNPMLAVSKLREGRGRVRYLREDERDRLLRETAKDPTLHLLTVLALSTAARAGELCSLRWDDVEIKEQRLLFRITKNAQPRVVWVHGEALRLVREHAKVRRLDGRLFASSRGGKYDYAKPFRAACAAAKVADFRFHDLRHSAATYLAREGATEQQLKAIGGWKSGVVSRYVHLAAGDAKDVLERMNEKILGK
jgi:integrase